MECKACGFQRAPCPYDRRIKKGTMNRGPYKGEMQEGTRWLRGSGQGIACLQVQDRRSMLRHYKGK
jgi:hypothetical protein